MNNVKRLVSSIVLCIALLCSFLLPNLVVEVQAQTPIELTKPTVKEAMLKSQQFMLQNVKKPGYENEWYVLSLARSGSVVPANYYQTYYDNLVNTVIEKKGGLTRNKFTEYSRVILALTSIGKDPRYVGGYNLVEKLYDFDNVKKQGINGPIFALIALDTNNYQIPKLSSTVTNSRQKMIDYIVSKQLADGGFALSGSKGDVDITAMALQALSTYKNQPKVKAAIDKALLYLQNVQLTNGGYLSWDSENVESVSQVVVALTSLGIDPKKDRRFIKGIGNWTVSNLLTFYNSKDGAFKHILKGTTNSMATEQATYALAAYNRFINKNNKLYDMSDVKPFITLTVNSINNYSTAITGKADGYAKIVATVNNKTIGSTTANNKGVYNLKIPKQKAGVKIKVTATDKAGKKKEMIISVGKKK
ncbi:Ig-like domain-containing protein [Bacillus sp. JJ722]|uniref:Ig-like domain-containing protein n=1 Tax=Bacillus sp. JJ722 TaxID=3122973 RepID=UPI0030008DDA